MTLTRPFALFSLLNRRIVSLSNPTITPTRYMSTHAEITKKVRRAERTHECTLLDIAVQTPSVKSFRLKLPPTSFDASKGEVFEFQPGNWVDFFAPNLKEVGGFSITSTPLELAESQTFELAVKYSPRNPVASWLHNSARVGDMVGARVGGLFFWEEGLWDQLLDERKRKPRKEGVDVVFIAAGVGLTPLMSMVAHLATLNLASKKEDRKVIGHVLHATKATERLFSDRLLGLARMEGSGIKATFHVTGSADVGSSTENVVNRRLAEDDLRSLLAPNSADSSPVVFLCGPNSFEADVLAALKKIGVPEDRIRFEKWW